MNLLKIPKLITNRPSEDIDRPNQENNSHFDLKGNIQKILTSLRSNISKEITNLDNTIRGISSLRKIPTIGLSAILLLPIGVEAAVADSNINQVNVKPNPVENTESLSIEQLSPELEEKMKILQDLHIALSETGGVRGTLEIDLAIRLNPSLYYDPNAYSAKLDSPLVQGVVNQYFEKIKKLHNDKFQFKSVEAYEQALKFRNELHQELEDIAKEYGFTYPFQYSQYMDIVDFRIYELIDILNAMVYSPGEKSKEEDIGDLKNLISELPTDKKLEVIKNFYKITNQDNLDLSKKTNDEITQIILGILDYLIEINSGARSSIQSFMGRNEKFVSDSVGLLREALMENSRYDRIPNEKKMYLRIVKKKMANDIYTDLSNLLNRQQITIEELAKTAHLIFVLYDGNYPHLIKNGVELETGEYISTPKILECLLTLSPEQIKELMGIIKNHFELDTEHYDISFSTVTPVLPK